MRKALIALSLLAAPVVASAGFINGLTLVMWMQDPTPQTGFLTQRAIGYVMAVADAEVDKTFCPPGPMTANQVAETVMYSVQGRQDPRLQEPAHVLVKDAISKAYPCKSTQARK